MRLNHLVTVTTLGIVITSCDLLDKKRGNSGVQPPSDSAKDEIRWLSLEDPDCVRSESAKGRYSTEISTYQYDGATVAEKKVNLPVGPGTMSAFASKNIVGTLLDYKAKYSCKYTKSGNRECESQKDDKFQGEELKLCRSDMKYQRDSLESVALTSHAAVEDAYSFYSSITDAKSGLPKSIMFIQPRLERVYKKSDGTEVKKYDQDNAGFTSIELGKNPVKYGLIMIMPTSIASYKKFPVNLWEVPFVLKHEFGHHVFHHYVSDKDDSSNLEAHFGGDIADILPNESSRVPRDDGMSLASTSSAALGGINETFADLFAYFSQESATGQVNGVDCLSVSRDPASPTTRAGRVKKITAYDLDIFEGRAEAPKRTDCGEPNFDDTHDIAMMLGHPLAKFIETSEPSGKGKDRAKHLLNWAIEMNKIVESGSSNVNLDNLVAALITSVKSHSEASDFKSACSVLTPAINGLKTASAACE